MNKDSLIPKMGIIVLIIFYTYSTSAQLLLNEICATNYSGIQSSSGNYDDWIELHNNSGSSLNIDGYGLSDDSTKRYRFTFPSYTLNAGAKVLVFANGKTNDVIANHWEMAVNGHSSWRYASGSASIDTNWRNLSFNQTVWSSGNGGVGFADGDDGTTVPVGVSVMMCKTFTIPDTSKIAKAILMMDYDDGFVAYLNGVEIARSNLGTQGVRPLWNDVANASHEAQVYQGLPIDSFYLPQKSFKSLLRPGTNVLAVETHNSTPTGNDLTSTPYLFFAMTNSSTTFSSVPSWFVSSPQNYFSANFKLARSGDKLWLTSPGGTTVDSKAYPPMQTNNSIGRIPDGSSNWCFISSPTPNASNNNSTCYTNYAGDPVFSKAGGYYSGSQSLTLTTSTSGATIRYTTNGDEPKSSSKLYSGSISISSSKVIRAKVFKSGYLSSNTVTNSYFINANSHLPTFAIATDSLNLWDYNTGIYVMGPNASPTSPYKGANFWMDWEKPASVEFFDRNKNLVVKFKADIKIYGNYSRAHPQKSFEIKLHDHYGLGSFTYPIFPDKPYVTDIDNIILRNGGTDAKKVHFRDAFMERLLKTTYAGYLAADPAVLYLNGAYWGVYLNNENHDNHWMKDNFGLNKDEIDYLKEGGSNIYIQQGSDASFWTLYNYATSQSPTSSQYYNQINSQLDLKNYTDYFVAETFYNNGDWMGSWTNNIQMWRPKKSGSKWRYFVYDLDFGLGYSGSVSDNRLSIARNPTAFCYSSEMFDAVLKNPTYKRYFINRYADLMNTIFLPANASSIMHSYKDTMAYDMTAHCAKWGSSVSSWNTYINDMMTFESGRLSVTKNQIKSMFNLQSIVTLTLKISPANAGRIEISTITPTTYPWTGDYFNGNPVTITAIPNPGYSFDHWKSTIAMTSNNPNQSVTYNFTGNDQITAYFTGSSAPVKLCVSELNYNSDAFYDAGDWIELHNFGSTSLNISGWWISDGLDNHKFQFPTGTAIPANGYLVLLEDSAKFKSQFPTVNNVLGNLGFNFSNGGDQVRIFDYNNSLYSSLYYQDLAPWPLTPDGDGYTLELTTNLANPNNASSWFAGCIGGSPGMAYSGNSLGPISISGNTNICSGQSTTLSCTTGSGFTYQWKNNGIYIPGATNSSLVVNQSGSYTVYISSQGCGSETVPTIVSVVGQLPSPQVTSASRCSSGNLTLTATSPDSLYWYNVSSGGSPLSTGLSYSTPIIYTTTTYYVEARNNCVSQRVPAVAEILSPPSAPSASGNSKCGPGSLSLTANGAGQIYWYSAATGGTLLDSGATYNTPVLNSTSTYYAETRNGACISARTAAVATIIPLSAPPTTSNVSICSAGTTTLTANSPEQIYWYSASSGGVLLSTGASYTTGIISSTTTYYVETGNICRSTRIPVVVTIGSNPNPPVLTSGSNCGPGTVTLSGSSSGQINWYTVSSGGNPVGTGSTYTTTSISATTTYYAETGSSGCSSTRVAVVAIINSIPAAPTASGNSLCGPGSVVLNATGSGQLYWYTAATGGTLLDSGTTFQTPNLNSSSTYYVETRNGTCKSVRSAAVATILAIPAAPNTNNVSGCGAGSVTITASSLEMIYWYSASSGGILLGTGSTYSTPSISTTTTYYVETGNNCRSIRVPVVAIITTQPSPPILTDTSICGSFSAVLHAVSPLQVNWYNVPSGGTALATGLTFTTPILNATTTYYADAGVGCNSVRVPVAVNITNNVAPPATADITRCGSGTVTLNASAPQQIYWYDSMTGGNQVGIGTTFTTPLLSATTTYYVTTTSGICSSARIPVQAIIGGTQITNQAEGVICGSGNVVLSASCSQPVDSIVWYDHPGGNVLAVGQYYITPLLSSTTTYYVVAASSCTGLPVPVTAFVFTNLSYNMPGDTLYLQSGTSSTLDAGAGFSSYSWSTNESTQSIVVSTGGWYYISVTDANGCPGTDSVFVDVFTGIGSIEGKNKLFVYPNPTHDYLNVSLPESTSKVFILKMLSIDGKILMQEEIKNSYTKMQNKVITLEKLAAGVYVLELMSNDNIATVKVIVQ